VPPTTRLAVIASSTMRCPWLLPWVEYPGWMENHLECPGDTGELEGETHGCAVDGGGWGPAGARGSDPGHHVRGWKYSEQELNREVVLALDDVGVGVAAGEEDGSAVEEHSRGVVAAGIFRSSQDALVPGVRGGVVHLGVSDALWAVTPREEIPVPHPPVITKWPSGSRTLLASTRGSFIASGFHTLATSG